MALDPNIALSVRPLQLQDPLESAGKAMQFRNMLTQNRLQEAELEQMPERNRLARIKAETEGRKAGLDEAESQVKIMAGLAGSVANARTPQERAAIYPRMLAEWRRLNLPGSDAAPDQWDESFLPHMQAMVSRGLAPKEVTERGDAAGLYQNQNTPGVQVNALATQPEVEGVPLPADGSEPVMPEMQVTADPPAGDKLRKQAADMRTLGTPAALAEADRLEQRAKSADEFQFKQRDQYQPVGGGVTFNKATNQYLVDGRSATAAEIQKIENTKAKNSAMNIGLNTYEKELNKKDADVVSEARTGAERAIEFADQVGLIRDVLKGYSGGPWSQVQADLGKYLPGSDFAKATTADQIARGIQTKLAPQARAVGSGSTSDFEMKMYLESIPSLMTTAQGREYMATIAQRLAERAAIAADIKDELVRGGKYSVKGYRERLKAEFGDKFLSEEELKMVQPQGKKEGSTNNPYKIKGDDGYKALAPGSYFTGPDGVLRQKP